MLKSLRFSIAGLMGVVFVVAIGVAALHRSSPMWAGAMFLLTCAILALGIVGLAFRREHRAWWFGFSLFGWSYLAISLSSSFVEELTLPTESLLYAVAPLLRLQLEPAVNAVAEQPSVDVVAGPGAPGWWHNYLRIGRCLWALVAAIVGGMLSRLFFGPTRETTPKIADQKLPEPQTSVITRYWLVKPVVFALAGLGTVGLVISARSVLEPSLWAGIVFLLTAALICLAVVGAILGRGTNREVWLGAAIFGGGFFMATFACLLGGEDWSNVPTVELLNAAKPMLEVAGRDKPAAGSDSVAAANARIYRALDQPVAMHFAGDSLANVLKHIQRATKTPDDHTVQFYVEPSRSPFAIDDIEPVRIDLDGIPLKTSLRLCLKQLDRDYEIRDGMIVITSEPRMLLAPRMMRAPLDHSYLVAGHCVLALIAAVIGGILAPVVSDWRRAPAGT